jgi:hypothetical protein
MMLRVPPLGLKQFFSGFFFLSVPGRVSVASDREIDQGNPALMGMDGSLSLASLQGE